MTKTFSIGRFVFNVTYPEEILFPDNFLKFETTGETPLWEYRFTIADRIEIPEGRPVYTRPGLSVHRNGSVEQRLIGIPGGETYALASEYSSFTDIIVLRDILQSLTVDTIFSSLFSFEKQLLKQDALILHCCFTDIGDEALLFSGPSGTGKSTQGDLWVKYRNAVVLNGDRAVIDFSGDTITANAFPVCGSSEICHPGRMPVKALVLPVQAPVNEAKPLSMRDAYARLYSQFTMNSWDKPSLLRAMDLIDRFVREIPVYELQCTISKEAVEKTEEMIR